MVNKKLKNEQLKKADKLEEKKETSDQQASNKKTSKFEGHILKLASYIAVCIGGLALGIGGILQKCNLTWTKLPIIQDFANAIAWAVVSYLSCKFIIKKRKLWMWIVWGVAVALIITGIIL